MDESTSSLQANPESLQVVQRGWHPERGATAKYGLKGTFARSPPNPLHVFHMAMGVDVNAATFNTSSNISTCSLDG